MQCTMMLNMVWLWLFLLSALVGTEAHSEKGFCPFVCMCKWKSGKQSVECTDRALITVPENIDPESQVINMSNNNLQILPKETFRRVGLINLQRVFLRNCRIGQIDNKSFRGLRNLVELDLAHNLLTSVPTPIFADMPFLRELTLSHNPIQKIDSSAFGKAHGLLRLDLSYCEIQNISPNAFQGIEQLEQLKLEGNKLIELRPRTIEMLQRLHSIELQGNPWQCDCRMRMIKEFITEHNIPAPTVPLCAGGPERIKDKPFSDLHIDDFGCKPEILPTSRYVEATAGENVTLWCRASAVPAPEIKWFQNGKQLLNNSMFNTFQKVYVYTEGTFEKRSRLVLTNSQETDVIEFYCVTENRAGNTEANYTVHVSGSGSGLSGLGAGYIAGLSAALVILILFILLVILVLLVRIRRIPFQESKRPAQIEVVTVVNNSTLGNGKSIITTPVSDIETSSFIERKPPTELNVTCTNPVQKPPRLAEVPYPTSHYSSSASMMTPAPCYASPSSGSGNNPDLINHTKRFGSGDLSAATTEAVTVIIEPVAGGGEDAVDAVARPGSGEYSRHGSDSLYPSSMWEGSSSSDVFGRREHGYDDKTPIIGDSASAGGSEDDIEYCSKSLPRKHLAHVNPGYPADYGLPIIEGGKRSREPPPPPPNAKTIRVWQRGGVPVLPPVSALKRAFSSTRNSPDEGYQEGCGTDV